jgi:hypothetical protein
MSASNEAKIARGPCRRRPDGITAHAAVSRSAQSSPITSASPGVCDGSQHVALRQSSLRIQLAELEHKPQVPS